MILYSSHFIIFKDTKNHFVPLLVGPTLITLSFVGFLGNRICSYKESSHKICHIELICVGWSSRGDFITTISLWSSPSSASDICSTLYYVSIPGKIVIYQLEINFAYDFVKWLCMFISILGCSLFSEVYSFDLY